MSQIFVDTLLLIFSLLSFIGVFVIAFVLIKYFGKKNSNNDKSANNFN
ncbi:hypothetical protein SAMN05216249_11461 [Acetitomaculum ruminis DSM 5522]|uniref:Uncharacterized protein n=1 Tax=Acetitomaculum ruminis DSM 5522 TaxID=1120918 RepID=A0A1I0ZH14_9FIRM|nr:hypothetical protein SAMN05216249_11461 [Acetitomaculum ruminis DSM 5522]